MRSPFVTRGPERPVLRRLGLAALVLFVVADVALIGLAVRHSRSTPDNAAVAIGNQTPVSPSSQPAETAARTLTSITVAAGADAVTSKSYGSCHDGYATIADMRIAGVSQVIAQTGSAEPAAFVGFTRSCATRVWSIRNGSWRQVAGLSVPRGATAAAGDAVWVVGVKGGLVVSPTGTALGHPANPCLKSGALRLTPSYVAASSAKIAAVFCTKAATAAGQVRLVYGTTDGGKTWSEYAGARTVGAKATGRKDGLDGAGRIAAASGLGGQHLGVLLANAGCAGLQLRTSADGGRNWTVGGCLPDAVAADAVAVLSGSSSNAVVATIGADQVVTYASSDNGKTWQTTP